MRQRTSGQRPRKFGYRIEHELSATAIIYCNCYLAAGGGRDSSVGVGAHHGSIWFDSAETRLNGFGVSVRSTRVRKAALR